MMTGYQKAACALLFVGLLLIFAGTVAFEASLPFLGTGLKIVGILSALSTPWVLRREELRRKKEEDRSYQ